jgi:two-component system sensor histidine kinase/response regulator
MTAVSDRFRKPGRLEQLLQRRHWLRHLPWLVLAATLAGSWQLWRHAEQNAWLERKVEFDLRVQGAADEITRRMQEYEQVLYGVRGFLNNQHAVERREYAGYMDALELARRVPGIQGVSYAPFVRGAEQAAHTAAMRRDGLDDYAIRAAGGRGPFAPVAYIAPETPRNLRVVGFDNFGSPERRAALQRAWDTGQPVLSANLALLQDDAHAPRQGRLMVLPVYRAGMPHATAAERRRNIAGWLAAEFHVSDFMAGLFAVDANELAIRVFDTGDPSSQGPLFDSSPEAGAGDTAAPRFAASRAVEIAGRTWLVSAHSLPAFDAGVDKSGTRLVALSAVLLSVILAWVTAFLVRDRTRALRFAEGVTTELRRSQELQALLQESERRWKLALEAVGDGVWDWDLTTGRMTYSRHFEEMLGYAPGELERDHEAVIWRIHPDDQQRSREELAAYLKGRTAVYASERRVLCKDGSWKWVLARGMVLDRGADGRFRRMIGTHTDISKRRAMEQALQDARQVSDDIINSLPGNFYMFDAEGRLIRWNRTSERVLGYTSAELARLRLEHFFDAEDFPPVREAARLVFEAGEAEVESLLLLKNGATIPYHFTARRTTIAGQHYMVGVGMDVSARQAAEAAVRENDERYRAIFSSAQDFIFTIDADNRITSITDYFCEAMGYRMDEVRGAAIEGFFTEQSMKLVREMIALKAENHATITRYEADLVTRGGRLIPVEINSALIFRDGKLLGSQGIARDITKRRNYEAALRESEEKYRGLFESAGDFAYSTDLEGRFTAISETLLQATGYGRDELVSIKQILSPDQLALAREMTAAKVSGSRATTRYELVITTRDGRPIPIEIVSTLVYREGKPVGVQGIGRDMAERKRAEELLRQSERTYRELMEQAAEAIFVADPQGRYYVDANQAACDLLGYVREELIGAEFNSIFHPEDVAKGSMRRAEMRSGQIVHTRRRLRRKDGSYVPVELSARMLSDGRLQALGRDISKWLERESVLQESHIKAEAASRAKSEFLANMSHEIRTPMNSVIGMARLALARETEPRQIGYLEKILMSGEHLLGIIDDILDFSKIEAGKIRIENTSFDLRAVLDSLANLMADKAIAKGLEFSVEVDPSLPAILQGDPLRLRQILLNFVDNAIKFTSRGSVNVRARREPDEQAGCAAFFEVVDTGIGLSQVEMAMLFRPFQQSDGSVTRKYGGTGLGLSISKRLVELMGGEAGVESAPGRGSRFWFRVRLDVGRPDGSQTSPHPVDRRDVQAAIRNARILLAENNVLNQQVAREFLEIAGCMVQVANNGYEVLDLLQKEHFDCVLMDIQMPLLDGMEATRQIRANQAFAAIPVIAVTANALEEERQRCMESGMNDFVTKPLRPEALYAVLAKWLSRQMLPLSVPERRKQARAEFPRRTAMIDFAVLSDLVGGNPEKMRQMAHRFMESARDDMEKVQLALERRDLNALKEMGHHIKSPAAMVGAADLAELCQQLETNRDDLGRAQELVSSMFGMLAEIEEEIRAQFP